MKTTDYSRIAPIYDVNPIRSRWEPEPAIAAALAGTSGPVRVLDLACGTGNFLAAQRAAFSDPRLVWHGCDLSRDMLEFARTKLPGIELKEADAAALPYDNGLFLLVTCNFAFHHFREKSRALGEIRRVLAPGGAFVLNNICPENMQHSWVYHYFPVARAIDHGRFWPKRRLVRELQGLGFSVYLKTEVTEKPFNLRELEAEAANRDMSQLQLTSETQYRRGLERLRADAKRRGEYAGDFALIQLTAHLRE